MSRHAIGGFDILPLGEDALLLRLAPGAPSDAGSTQGDAVQINARVHALALAIEQARPEWLRAVVPAYASLALHFDATLLDATLLDAGLLDAHLLDAHSIDTRSLGEPSSDLPQPHAQVLAWLRRSGVLSARIPHRAHTSNAPEAQAQPPTLEIPVCYGGACGPDLDAVAQYAGLTPQQLIAGHSSQDYPVAMLGFAPGFPYLLGLDPALAMPRLDTPRTRVPAGSVGIGGTQTGIYPREGPGGWHLIGRTPLILFDASRDSPSLLAPGQRVRFVPIDADAFSRMADAARADMRPQATADTQSRNMGAA